MEEHSSLRIPVATYRLQMSHRFTFTDGQKLVPYLNDLGITDVYSSPCFKTGKGSISGYDIVDPNMLGPEMGGEPAFDRFIKELKAHDMGFILDIVPNHMNVESDENMWWMGVLENGPSSPYAGFFDIDWHPTKRELENKVLIPILGDQYGAILENQELKLGFEKGAFFLSYFDHRLPILPETYKDILSHRIDEAETLPGGDHPDFAELMSIITALTCLPSYTDRDPEKVVERHREKEIVKRRLQSLCDRNPAIRAYIEGNVAIYNGRAGDTKSFNLLDDLLHKQVWRLSFWSVATEEINYRRFFDINGLAATRMENPEVFTKCNDLLSRLIREGKVTGLRIDHPDGLYDPARYFRELQGLCFVETRRGRAGGQSGSAAPGDDPEARVRKEYEEAVSSDPRFKPFYIVGEKILARDEKVPEDWAIFSTIGYVFLNPLNGIFIETGHGRAFDRIYERFIDEKIRYTDLVYEKKKLITLTSLSAEINALGQFLNRLSEKNRHTRDFTLNSLRTVIMEVISCFPVYRTYVTTAGVEERDRRYIAQAVREGKRKNPALNASIFDFLHRVLLLKYPADMSEADRAQLLDFVMRFQQVTGPVTAKGIEDTVFYIYNKFVSLNEVGGSPDKFGTTLDAFHRQNMETSIERPYSLVTTSTHDTKRGEDARARINVLSEIPDEWRTRVARWSRLNRKKKRMADDRPVPDSNEEYLLYQTLLAIWPPGAELPGSEEYAQFIQRIKEYMLKAIREAKINSSWISQEPSYEEGVLGFVEDILSRASANPFVKDLVEFQEKISYMGMFNSLSQALIKITSPGVPDFYQGSELWDLNLVDPDNRKPVDFKIRKNMLSRLKRQAALHGEDRSRMIKGLLSTWPTGAIKLYLTYTALGFRKEKAFLFRDGAYVSLSSEGTRRENVCAFARFKEKSIVITVVPRFLTHLIDSPKDLPLGKVWEGSWITLSDEVTANLFRDVFTGREIFAVEEEGRRVLALDQVFAGFPVALLEGMEGATRDKGPQIKA